MKKIGIVGGIGWQSTAEYYAQLCRRSEQAHRTSGRPGPATMPEISIESLDLARAICCLGRNDDEQSWLQFDKYHRSALERLQMSGAEVALIASNTAHHRFHEIVGGLQLPVISILCAMAKESARLGITRVLLLGTAMTMSSDRFREELQRYGIEAAGPADENLRKMTTELIEDLQLSKRAGARERLLRIVKLSRSVPSKHHSAVALACTELPLAFDSESALPTFEYDGIRFLNSTALHVEAAFNFAAETHRVEERSGLWPGSADR